MESLLMTTAPRPKQRWDTLDYQRITSAIHRHGELVVGFADGSEARLSPRPLVSPDVPQPDWSNLRIEEFHLVAPSAAGNIEIPWDVIRVRTDPEYDTFWATLVAERPAPAVASFTETAG